MDWQSGGACNRYGISTKVKLLPVPSSPSSPLLLSSPPFLLPSSPPLPSLPLPSLPLLLTSSYISSETKLRDVTEEEMELQDLRQSPTNPVRSTIMLTSSSNYPSYPLSDVLLPQVAVYELVPIMRPVVLMGPSTKESRVLLPW